MHRPLLAALATALSLLACSRADTSSLFGADAHAASLPGSAVASASIAAPTAGPALAAPALAAPTLAAPAELLAPLPSLAPLVKRLRPVVVNINSKFRPHPQKRRGLPNPHLQNPDGNEDGQEDGQDEQDPMQRFFHYFGPHGQMPQDTEPRSGLGSGFLIGDGLVITNNHVVQVQDTQGGKFRPMDEIKIITDDNAPGGAREYPARLVGADPKSDIALLSIEDGRAKSLPGAQLGDSDTLEVGDYVVAIGEPFGLQATVTAGIISAKERAQFGGAYGAYSDYLQTDASINPGNSGGPLFNLRGEVVGVNAAIISGANTIGFAIPIAVVKQILPQLREKGKVVRGFLGVSLQALTQDTAEQLGLKSTQGALVADVVAGGGAEAAGVLAGDVITQIDGKTVADNNMLMREVGALPPGKKTQLAVIRDGKEKSITVTLKNRPEEVEGEISSESGANSSSSGDPLGLTVEALTPELARRARVDAATKGVVVTDLDAESPGAAEGIQPGDVIVELNRAAIGSVADYRKALKALKPGGTALLRVRRGAQAEYLTVRVPK